MSYAQNLSALVDELMKLGPKTVPDLARAMNMRRQTIYQWRTRKLVDRAAHGNLLLIKDAAEREVAQALALGTHSLTMSAILGQAESCLRASAAFESSQEGAAS
jgi:hypothetical protein